MRPAATAATTSRSSSGATRLEQKPAPPSAITRRGTLGSSRPEYTTIRGALIARAALQHGLAVQIGHQPAHHHHVDRKALDRVEKALAVARGGHHPEALVLVEQLAQAAQQQRMIVGEQQPDHAPMGSRAVIGDRRRRAAAPCRSSAQVTSMSDG